MLGVGAQWNQQALETPACLKLDVTSGSEFPRKLSGRERQRLRAAQQLRLTAESRVAPARQTMIIIYIRLVLLPNNRIRYCVVLGKDVTNLVVFNKALLRSIGCAAPVANDIALFITPFFNCFRDSTRICCQHNPWLLKLSIINYKV